MRTRNPPFHLSVSMSLVLALTWSLSGPALAYDFVEIARAGLGEDFSGFQPDVCISNLGRVGFLGYPPSSVTQGMYTGIGGSTTKIVDENEFPFVGFDRPTIDDLDTMLFRAGSDSSMASVMGGNGGALTIYAEPPTDPFIGPNWFSAIINSTGTALLLGGVTFGGELHLSTGPSGPILLYDGSAIGYGAFFGTDFNDLGVVASVVGSGPGDFTSVIRGNGGAVTIIVEPSDGLGGIGGSLSLNNSGVVAFVAGSGVDEGIYTGDGGSLVRIIDRSGPYSGFNHYYGPAINDSGTVAFLALLDGGGEGIFVGPDANADKIIRTGDPLFGSTVTSLSFGPFGLSDSGQLAFWAALADGTQAIVRADPETLSISPSSGTLVTTQGFDLTLIVKSATLSVVGGSATLNDVDVTALLGSCSIFGTLLSGGQTFRCPLLSGGFLGGGTHILSVTLDLSDGSSISDSVTWEVLENTEP